MSEEDERVRRSAIRLVADIQSVQGNLEFEVTSFFERLRKELFSADKTVFSNVEVSRILSRLQSLMIDLLSQIADKISVEAVKHIQIAIGRPKDIRESEIIAEKIAAEVKPEARNYMFSKYVQNLENRIKTLEERESSRKNWLRKVLTQDKKYKILALLEKGASNYAEIAKQLSLSKSKVREYVRELEKNDLISVDKTKKPHSITLKQTLWI
ncbi:MAG: winged helix-turn-helix domain-containing protein [Candidatus Freyrarchaeum guaymaensis]|nr:winged helix-turn-helix domain-containing protein [Candidatus Sigynarchaeota archaeon]